MYKGGVKAPQSWSFPRWHGEGQQPELLLERSMNTLSQGQALRMQLVWRGFQGAHVGKGKLEEERIGLVQRNDCTEGVVYFSVDQCAGELQSYAYRMLGGGD